MLLKNYQDHGPINLYRTSGQLEIFSSYIQNTEGLYAQFFFSNSMHCFIQCNNKNKGQFLKITPLLHILSIAFINIYIGTSSSIYCQSNLNSLYHTIRLLHSGSKNAFPLSSNCSMQLEHKKFCWHLTQ